MRNNPNYFFNFLGEQSHIQDFYVSLGIKLSTSLNINITPISLILITVFAHIFYIIIVQNVAETFIIPHVN